MVNKGTWMKVPYEREWEVIHFGSEECVYDAYVA